MAVTSLVRDWWYLYRCSYGNQVPSGFFGRAPVYAQNPDHVVALESAHLAAGYVPTVGGYIGSRRSCPKGIGGKVCQNSGKDCSLHNYGIAWDIEYNHNPHFKRRLTKTALWKLYRGGWTKYNPDIVASILGVKNTHGEPLFRWLGYAIGDTMHWQINVPPSRQEVDWSTVGDGTIPVASTSGGEDMYLPLGYSDGFRSNPKRKEDVRWLQKALNRAGLNAGVEDGAYGNDTATAVAKLVAGSDGRTFGATQLDVLLAEAYTSDASNVVPAHIHAVPKRTVVIEKSLTGGAI